MGLDEDMENVDQQPVAKANEHGDIDNIDFANYKGIYGDEDAQQKYQCPETGAHFEPRDLCKRLYKVVDKRKPFEMELYGENMLRDGVGTSLIAVAPYRKSKPSSGGQVTIGKITSMDKAVYASNDY